MLLPWTSPDAHNAGIGRHRREPKIGPLWPCDFSVSPPPPSHLPPSRPRCRASVVGEWTSEPGAGKVNQRGDAGRAWVDPSGSPMKTMAACAKVCLRLVSSVEADARLAERANRLLTD